MRKKQLIPDQEPVLLFVERELNVCMIYGCSENMLLIQTSATLDVVMTYLIASMGLQIIWCSGLAFLDAYALAKKKVLHNHVLVSLFVVGDWVTATLSLAAASASAGVTMLYFADVANCRLGQECLKYQISVAFAFLSWITIALSSLIMFWLLAAG
ncbi:hypothetical protein RHSIM_Rhsim02G0035900 [Rhododendron simsii]|uniref:CASP-like protein n=1 Tax=Rhododendron simsii TaxID=118357 RepID=A0A834LY08_RHOSS|nr:hypothetical protein RHSIM_Rhsim02G0035900 [Rhododendron simsii]